MIGRFFGRVSGDRIMIGELQTSVRVETSLPLGSFVMVDVDDVDGKLIADNIELIEYKEKKGVNMYYRFKVTDERQIDIKRVLDENSDQDVLIVTIGNDGMLAVRDRFLKQFTVADHKKLGVFELCATWASQGYPAYLAKTWYVRPDLNISGAHFFTVSASEIAEIGRQYNIARKYLADKHVEKIEVKVTAFDREQEVKK